MTTRTKAEHRLTLGDRLSRLSFVEACKLLGPKGRELIRQGAKWPIEFDEQVYFAGDLFRLKLPDDGGETTDVIVTITQRADQRNRLLWNCTCCETVCEHVGAAFSLILESKTALGLAALPPERIPVESLSEEELIKHALSEREERAKSERMKLVSSQPDQPWTDYTVTSELSGKTYRVALRGEELGQSYCSCPDFRSNTLGTCKHILHVLRKVRKKFPDSIRRKPYRQSFFAVHLQYGRELALRLLTPQRIRPEAQKIVAPIIGRDIENIPDLLSKVTRLQALGHDVTIYPDAEEFIQHRLFQHRIAARVAEIRRNPAKHPLRRELLTAELLPYQLDGIAFAIGAGRAILADEMGLGKTIQGIGVAELLAREAGIRKVLVICPTSLKSQWRSEIARFCDRACQLVMGSNAERPQQYASDAFFTVCNYEQVLRDIVVIERSTWDLIILDEGQRIKNWEAKTARVIKGLRSKFALVLSGTPLENRLDELFSVVEFIDGRRLAPAFRFFNRHRVTDEKGKILGYKNLDQLRATIKPILLRRTRESVKIDVPPRTTEIVRITPTEEQEAIHSAQMKIVSTIARKKFFTEMDLLRLRQALLMCRLAANASILVNKKPPNYSSKLERMEDLLDQLFAEENRKAVLFSEWTSMLDLIEPLLQKRQLQYVRLDGSVPQKDRQQLVNRFQNEADCRLFITTNAGSTGLNLQAANTVINVDLPWNPAVLEQRIARAHRMGQRQPVQVYVLITDGTLEEQLLTTLSQKSDLSLAALDATSEVKEVDFISGMDEMRSRLEILLGAKPVAPVDESLKQEQHEQVASLNGAQRERVSAAAGEMLGAAFRLLGELTIPSEPTEESRKLASDLRGRLVECVEPDAAGRPRLTITLPNNSALDDLAQTLAKLLLVEKG